MADMVDNRNTIVRVEAGEDSRSESCPLWQVTECLPKVESNMITQAETAQLLRTLQMGLIMICLSLIHFPPKH